MSNDNWRTPDWLYNYCEQAFGPFEVDLAASAENARCAHYIDIATNALVTDWQAYGNNGFCNPPYSNLPPWLLRAKAYSQNKGFASTWILPTFNGEKHWLTNVYQRGASHVINICGRVAFLRLANERKTPKMTTPTNKELRTHGLTLPQFELLRKANDNTLERYRVHLFGVSAVTLNALSQGGFIRLDYANDEEKRQSLLNQRNEAIRLAKIALCENDDWLTAFNELKHATQFDSQRDQRMTVISDYGKEIIARLMAYPQGN